MKRTSYVRVSIAAAVLVMMLLSVVGAPVLVLAQDPPAGETPTVEPTTPAPPTETPTETPTPTATVVDPTATPTPSPTGVIGTATATVTAIATVTPVPGGPVPIPEPITVVLFGTGLAALSAAVASRRGKSGK
jgi:hypothetical protein